MIYVGLDKGTAELDMLAYEQIGAGNFIAYVNGRINMLKAHSSLLTLYTIIHCIIWYANTDSGPLIGLLIADYYDANYHRMRQCVNQIRILKFNMHSIG